MPLPAPITDLAALYLEQSGAVLIGQPQSRAVLQLQNFLSRNAQPYHVVDPTDDAAAAALIEQYGAALADVVAVCPNGSVLLDPSEPALARCLGLLGGAAYDQVFAPVRARIQDGRASTVDLTQVSFMNSSGILTLVRWITKAKAHGAGTGYKIVLRYDRNVTWQRTSIPTLAKLAPNVVVPSEING